MSTSLFFFYFKYIKLFDHDIYIFVFPIKMRRCLFSIGKKLKTVNKRVSSTEFLKITTTIKWQNVFKSLNPKVIPTQLKQMSYSFNSNAHVLRSKARRSELNSWFYIKLMHFLVFAVRPTGLLLRWKKSTESKRQRRRRRKTGWAINVVIQEKTNYKYNFLPRTLTVCWSGGTQLKVSSFRKWKYCGQ